MTKNRILLAGASLLLLAVSLSAPGPAWAYTVRPEHPRIWLTPETLTRLRSPANLNSSRWTFLKRLCDASPASFDIGVLDYALAYQISRNPAYADKAIDLMQRWVNGGLDTITPDSGFYTRTVLPAMACGYDWCYDRLTATQRTQFRAQMEAWADWVWPETNPARVNGWSVSNPGDNYYHGFMMTWLIGLALAGESPKAQGYIDLALKKWQEVVRPYLESYGAGGYFLEGTTYGAGSLFRIFWYLSAHASATGENLLNAAGMTWPRQAMLCKLYLTTPTLDRVYPGGDQARTSSAPLSDYDRGAGLVGLNYLDQTTAGNAKWWLDHIWPDTDQWKFTQWEECLWYREDMAGIDYTQALPTGYLAPGAGWMTSRGGWSSDAVQVAMICGPVREAHQDRANNGFVIFCGEWLAAMARLTSHDGLFGDAPHHNTLTIGDGGQAWEQTKGRVAHFADTGRYAYFAGDAPDAYGDLVTQFRRELVFLKPNRVVVFDRMNARDAGQVKAWHLQTLAAPTVGGDGYQVTVGSKTLFGKALLPVKATLEKLPIQLGSGSETTSWRVQVVAPVGQNVEHFLNVLEVAPSSQGSATAATGVTTGRTTLMGCQIGDQVVMFDVANPAGASVEYETGAAAAREHFVLDQKPDQWYHVVEAAPGGETLSEQRIQATDQGVVSFTTTGTGARRLSLRPLAKLLDVLSVTFRPSPVIGGAASTGEITLSAPAPVGGAIVALTSSTPAVTVPASVTVAAGSTTVPFPVSTLAVAAPTSVIVSAAYTGMTQTGTLEVAPPPVMTLGLSPAGIAGPGTVAGVVTLGGPAPVGGAVIGLTSAAPSVVQVPATITVAAGSTTASFAVTVGAVSTPRAVSIVTSRWGTPLVAELTVSPAPSVAAGTLRHVGVFRPSTREWFFREPDGTAIVRRFGGPGDLPVRADYLGTGEAQTAVFRPTTREWFIRAPDGSMIPVQFGGPDDVPVPGDYFGLGRAQIAVFRTTTREWFIRRDDGSAASVQFGGAGDQPVPADYFGLGRVQVAVFRPRTAEWFLRTDTGGTVPIQWGTRGDQPVPGDYFGLGRAQIAVFRPSTREWFLRDDRSHATRLVFGGPGDVPVPGGYLGTGRTMLAVFRPATASWFVRTDAGTTVSVRWGNPGDVPTPTR